MERYGKGREGKEGGEGKKVIGKEGRGITRDRGRERGREEWEKGNEGDHRRQKRGLRELGPLLLLGEEA